MKKILNLIILVTINNIIFAQVNPKKCNTTNLVNIEVKEDPNYLNARNNTIMENIAWIKANENLKRTTINIPTVVHIIHKNTHPNIGSGTNISNDQIEDALRVLNEDFSKTNPEFPNPPRTTFLSEAANPDLKFCLATIDPNGNPTTGITRTSTTQADWDADDDDFWDPCHEANGMKRTSCGGIDGWDPAKYLNIWVCNLSNSQGGGQTLGYAYLPGLTGNNKYKDGLVVDFQHFGTIGTAATSDGRTPTHEIGHYLGLEHTFCESNGCCDEDGGNVYDTPPTDGIYWSTVNNTTPSITSTDYNTCYDPSYSTLSSDYPDMHENYMSYATNTWMFTSDQKNVMQATLNGYRYNLKNSNVSVNCNGNISSINSSILNPINLYPNPSSGKILINISEEIISITISNLIGENVNVINENNSKSVNIEGLKNGIYFITINTSRTRYISKVILTK